MPRHEWQEVDGGASRFKGGSFAGVERVQGVIARFGVMIGFQRSDFRIEARTGENEGGIYAAQGSKGVGAVLLGVERSVGAFQFAHGCITVHGHDEQVA